MVRLVYRELRFETSVPVSDEQVDKVWVELNQYIDSCLQEAADAVIEAFRGDLPGLDYWMD